MIRFTAIAGTHNYQGLFNRKGKWFNPGSPCLEFLAERGVHAIVNRSGRGFDWTTSLNGWQAWRHWLKLRPKFEDWECGALCLYDRFMPQTVSEQYWMPGSDTHIIAHSYGGNVAIIAAALGLRINVLVTVSTPVRNDVLDQYGAAARKHIGWWIHYWSEGDSIQAAGGIGDGHLGTLREFPMADESIRLPMCAGHTGLLTDSRFIPELATVAERMRERHGRSDFLTSREQAEALSSRQ